MTHQKKTSRLILASKSQSRLSLLRNAGLRITSQPSNFDERKFENANFDLLPHEQAEQLAIEKARSVAKKNEKAFVIGSDQILLHNNKILHKANDTDELKKKLQALSGSTHTLISSAAIVIDHDCIFKTHLTANMSMYSVTEKELDHYIEKNGQKVLSSVGGYHFEGEGIRLFKAIEGDYFTILGFPLMPVLNELKKYGL